jgi:hypothetical protein
LQQLRNYNVGLDLLATVATSCRGGTAFPKKGTPKCLQDNCFAINRLFARSGGMDLAILCKRDPTRNPSKKGKKTMSQRNANLLWLKDMLEHLDDCRKQLDWAQDTRTQHMITETMLRDLDCCRRLCETLRRRGVFQGAC